MASSHTTMAGLLCLHNITAESGISNRDFFRKSKGNQKLQLLALLNYQLNN